MYAPPMVNALVNARRGSGPLYPEFRSHHELDPSIAVRGDGRHNALQRFTVEAKTSHDAFNFGHFSMGDFRDFSPFSCHFSVEVFYVCLGREVPAQTHGDCSRSNFGEPRRDDE